jgi:myo-inositol-1(or 4)-monophosphatase
LYHKLKKGFDISLCQQLEVGAGGDISRGIDIMAENIFIEHLKPFGMIDSEESGLVGDGRLRIILDPIDGSDNFLSKIPYYGSSIALENEEKIVVGVIANFANGDIFIKTRDYFRCGNLETLIFQDVVYNSCATVGIFERAYRSTKYAKKLFDAEIKYRIPGAAALSLAYAHNASFVLFEGSIREYDAKAGLFMCENLYKYEYNDLLLISKDLKQFNFLKNILLGDET